VRYALAPAPRSWLRRSDARQRAAREPGGGRGVAAAAAAALTLANPAGAAAKAESSTQTPAEKREVEQHQMVPRDVFDRLDAPATPAKPQ
jgi:hypothetical protein